MKLWMDKMFQFMDPENNGMRKVDKVKQSRRIEIKLKRWDLVLIRRKLKSGRIIVWLTMEIVEESVEKEQIKIYCMISKVFIVSFNQLK